MLQKIDGARRELLGRGCNVRREVTPEGLERWLVGDIALQSSLGVDVATAPAGGDGPHSIHTLRFRIARGEPRQDADPGGHDGNGALTISATEVEGFLSADLHIQMLHERFDALWDLPIEEASLQLEAEILGASYAKPIALAGDTVMVLVESVRLSATFAESPARTWLRTGRASEMTQAWRRLHFPRGSQVGRILSEFAHSVAAANLDSRAWFDALEHVPEMLMEARGTFRKPLPLGDGPYANAWLEPRHTFLALVKDRQPADEEKLTAQYDFLWKHFSVAQVARAGEAAAGADAEGHGYNVSELELLAEKVLSMPEVSSPTMEWMLLDALAYAECLALAQYVVPGKTMFGAPVQTPLEGETTRTKPGKAFLSAIGELLLEGVKLVATYVVAFFLTQGEQQSTWILTTGITAVRWIRRSLVPREASFTGKGGEVLQKMLGFSELFARPDFNAGAARDLLRRITYDGAVFSPWISHILDARLRREARGQPANTAA